MDVSNMNSTEGQNLVRELITLTGLPEALVSKELEQILELSGQKSASELTLEQLREAMLAYLEAMQADYLAAQESAPSEI